MYDHPHYGVLVLDEKWAGVNGEPMGLFHTYKDRIVVNLPLSECHKLP